MNAGFPQRGMNDAGQFEPVRGVFHYLSGGMMVMVPLWNRNQGEIAAAEAQRVAATARLEAAQLSAQAEVASAKTHAAEARKAADVIAAGVGLARKNLDVLRQMYELGRSTLPDVLAEQRRYLEMENAYTAVLREAFEARTSLALAQGELP
jgi:cobalt-zinc-cadmium efflux system outer membrane protein